ncbi:MAG TPA: hypothetical protein VGP26_24660 [Actinophytocola sp.]|nr:hypothetical protein [Actinophytocola sp.]
MSVSVCQVCGRPSDLFLCHRDVGELVTALRSLATGGVLRMVEVSRPRWRIPELPTRMVIAHSPGLLAELEVTIARQHRFGGAGGRAGTEPPLPVHLAAAELAAVARNTIGTWARDVAELHPHLQLPGTHAAAAAWLATFPTLLAEHPSAGELHEDITVLARRIRTMIDRPPDKVYLGICSARLQQVSAREWLLCPVDIYAERDKQVVQCPKCGTTHDAAWRRDRMLLKVDGQLATATDASRALSAYDCPVTASQIRKWAFRQKLTPHPPHPDDPRCYPRYRIGDIRTLLAEAASEDGGSAA